jgi:hypothetical protein
LPIFVADGVEIVRADREPIPEGSRVWGRETTLSVTEVRDSPSYSFYLPRPPRSYERVGVHVEHPLFGEQGRRKNAMSWFDVYGEPVDQPNGSLVQIDFQSVKDGIRTLPASSTGRILGLPKTTHVGFTPFCEPHDE